jgi:8-oxo-dGTP diphosphatase
MIRELNEELGAIFKYNDVTFIGSVTEDFTDHKELVHIYFWHDKEKTIRVFYEFEAVFFDSVEEAISQPKIMDYTIFGNKKMSRNRINKIRYKKRDENHPF